LSGYRIHEGFEPDVLSDIGLCLQSLKPTNIDYTVFVHATDRLGKLWINDSPPGNGDSPTSIWLPGDQIMDHHSLPIKAERISIGFYRLDTGERLTIDGTNETEFIIQNGP
jgi:hypothetical protein